MNKYPYTKILLDTHIHTHTHTYIYIYVYIYGEVVDFDKSDKMIKISEKVDKPTLTTDSTFVFF